ncbi:protein disulfide-isomerase [Plasmodium yoelii yoelii]|uniref:Protein disulfide-isomerase n=3 Tax=Plasmodium yoelii TaxID=5861 RepID=A0AAE9WVR2_PLAYO|nr:protein disulfide-isomerase [Plasmodium yoelii yoelii]
MNFEELKHFVNKNRFPLVSKIDHHNFFSIRSSGNNLILLLIDFQNDPNKYISQFTQFAKRYINLKEYIFSYIDGKYYEENLELYGVDSNKFPQIIVFSKNPREYYFEDYFDIDHIQNIIEDIENKRIKPKVEEFTKMKILMTKIKKQINYIIDKSFRTDVKSFIGFVCSLIMIIFTLVLVFHSIYSFVNKSESQYKIDAKKKKK